MTSRTRPRQPRRRTRFGLVLGSLLCGLAAAASAAAAKPPPPQPAPPAAPAAPAPPALRFLALGDSYTIGERVAPAARWPVQLAALLRARGLAVGEPEIVARTGWTVDDLAAALEESEPSGPYDLVSLQIGVNDEYRGRSAEVYRGAFRVLLGRAAAFAGGRAGRVIVLSIPDWSVTPFAARRNRPEAAAEIDRFNAVGREEAARAGARYVDVTPESRDAAKDPALLADDGLHPAPAMYAAWSRLALGAALDALGASRLPPPARAPGPPPPKPLAQRRSMNEERVREMGVARQAGWIEWDDLLQPARPQAVIREADLQVPPAFLEPDLERLDQPQEQGVAEKPQVLADPLRADVGAQGIESAPASIVEIRAARLSRPSSMRSAELPVTRAWVVELSTSDLICGAQSLRFCTSSKNR